MFLILDVTVSAWRSPSPTKPLLFLLSLQRDASYSSDPTYSVPDFKNNQYILACRVCVGKYCRGKYDALTPDVRDPKTHSLYDSTVGLLRNDTMDNPSIYVTYHDAQAYPEVRLVLLAQLSGVCSSFRQIIDLLTVFLFTLVNFPY